MMRRLLFLFILILMMWTVFACSGAESGEEEETSVATFFVDPAAQGEGDGSESQPFASLQEALDKAEQTHRIILAAGEHPCTSELVITGAIHLLGSADGVVTLQSDSACTWTLQEGAELHVEAVESAVDLTLQGGVVALSDIKVRGSAAALRIESALSFAANSVELESALGLWMQSVPTLNLEDISITGGSGGLNASGFDTLSLVGFTGSGISATALWLEGRDATLRDLQLSEIALDPEGTGGEGVVMAVETASVSDVTITQTADRGILIRGGTIEIEEVTITQSARAALSVMDGTMLSADSLELSDSNTLFFSAGATATVSNSAFSNGVNGALISGASTLILKTSTVTDCSDGAISIIGDGNSVVLEDNMFSGGTYGACVSVAGGGGTMTFRDNHFTSCVSAAISLLQTSNVTIEDNIIEAVLMDPVFSDIGDGITLVDATATIRNNEIRDTFGAGISLLRANGEISGNLIEGSGGAGVGIVAFGLEPTQVLSNQIVSAKGAGIIVLEADATVTGNNVSQTIFDAELALGDGVAFGAGANVVVTGNQLSQNGGNGIVFLDGAAGEIDQDTLTGNNYYGIREFCVGGSNDVAVGVANSYADNGLGDNLLCP